jgi:hypothetical protein
VDGPLRSLRAHGRPACTSGSRSRHSCRVSPPGPDVPVHFPIAFAEEELRTRVKASGGRRRLESTTWELSLGPARELGIEDRIVPVDRWNWEHEKSVIIALAIPRRVKVYPYLPICAHVRERGASLNTTVGLLWS